MDGAGTAVGRSRCELEMFEASGRAAPEHGRAPAPQVRSRAVSGGSTSDWLAGTASGSPARRAAAAVATHGPGDSDTGSAPAHAPGVGDGRLGPRPGPVRNRASPCLGRWSPRAQARGSRSRRQCPSAAPARMAANSFGASVREAELGRVGAHQHFHPVQTALLANAAKQSRLPVYVCLGAPGLAAQRRAVPPGRWRRRRSTVQTPRSWAVSCAVPAGRVRATARPSGAWKQSAHAQRQTSRHDRQGQAPQAARREVWLRPMIAQPARSAGRVAQHPRVLHATAPLRRDPLQHGAVHPVGTRLNVPGVGRRHRLVDEPVVASAGGRGTRWR